MTRTSFMVGISAIALAAGGHAQTTTTNGDNTDPNTGNRVVVSCTAGNSCSVTQTAGQTFSSTGSANASGGMNNTSSVTQTGNRQFAESRATGDRNETEVNQFAFNNSSSVSQTGTSGGTGNSLGYANYALVQQGNNTGVGNNNTSQIVQVRTAGASDDSGLNQAYTYQNFASGGSSNVAVQTQNGTNLYSLVNQGDQLGNGISVSNNSATVTQLSAGASSTIQQASNGNVALVSMFGGNNTPNTAPTPRTGANTSRVTQYNDQFQSGATAGTFVAAAPTTSANSPSSANSANVAITGLQNSSSVQQRGVQNTLEQSILNGGAGNTSATNANGVNPGTGAAFPPNRIEGNASIINQTGRGNYAATSIGGRVTTGGGSGNSATINQTQNDAAVTQTSLNSTQTPTTAHRALLYMRGILDRVSIVQTNNALGGSSSGAGTATQSGSLADVATLSFNSTTTVNQTGTNTARVTQGSRTETTGASNRTTITQVDAGDVVSTTPGSTLR